MDATCYVSNIRCNEKDPKCFIYYDLNSPLLHILSKRKFRLCAEEYSSGYNNQCKIP